MSEWRRLGAPSRSVLIASSPASVACVGVVKHDVCLSDFIIDLSMTGAFGGACAHLFAPLPVIGR